MSKIDGRSKRLIDITGNRYGRLTVISRCGSDKYHKPMWLCRCDCGNEKIINGAVLKRGDAISCGCMQGIRKDLDYKPLIMRRTHKNRLYNQWSGMIYRCTHEAASHYEHYGKRGISVCDDWLNSFESFAEWSLIHGYENNMEIDRIDTEGNYSPDNCRWISHKTNSRNRRPRGGSRSGVSGVVFRVNRSGNGGKWRANIGVDGKNISLGHYCTVTEAIRERKKAELVYWGFTNIED